MLPDSSSSCATRHAKARPRPLKSDMRFDTIMSRKALIAANWKMYKTPAEARAFVDAFLPLVAGHTRDEIALFPSPVLLPTVVPLPNCPWSSAPAARSCDAVSSHRLWWRPADNLITPPTVMAATDEAFDPALFVTITS